MIIINADDRCGWIQNWVWNSNKKDHHMEVSNPWGYPQLSSVDIHSTFPFSHLLSVHSWGYPNDFGNLHISSKESSSYPRPGSPVQVSRLRLDALSAPDQQQWNIVFKCVGTSIKDYEGDMWVVFCGGPIRQETQTLGRMKKVNGTCPVTLKNHMRW